MFDENQNFWPKSKFLTKIKIFDQIPNFWQKSKFWIENGNCGQIDRWELMFSFYYVSDKNLFVSDNTHIRVPYHTRNHQNFILFAQFSQYFV